MLRMQTDYGAQIYRLLHKRCTPAFAIFYRHHTVVFLPCDDTPSRPSTVYARAILLLTLVIYDKTATHIIKVFHSLVVQPVILVFSY